MAKERPTYLETDASGATTVKVALGPVGAHHCIIDLADWQKLLLDGHNLLLDYIVTHTGKPYATMPSKAKGVKQMVARVLVGAEKGELVFFRDGNPLNLRRNNLELRKVKRIQQAA